MTAQHYTDEARRYATFCRDHGENNLYRIAAGAADDDYAWTETLMKSINCLGCKREPSGFFQGVSFHYYTIPGPWEDKGSALEFDSEDYYATMVKAARIDELISGHSAVMDCYDPQKKVGLILDEWGTWWNVEPGTNPGFLFQQNTLRDALVASVHFDIFHKHADRLFMANIAQTVNVLQAMILTDGEHLVLTPTYHVFEMNNGHQDAASLRVDLRGSGARRQVGETQLETVTISASTKDGTALISLSNLDADQPIDVDLDLRGRGIAGTTARILTADTLQAHNSPEQPDSVAVRGFDGVSVTDGGLRVTLPAHSFVTIELGLD